MQNYYFVQHILQKLGDLYSLLKYKLSPYCTQILFNALGMVALIKMGTLPAFQELLVGVDDKQGKENPV